VASSLSSGPKSPSNFMFPPPCKSEVTVTGDYESREELVAVTFT